MRRYILLACLVIGYSIPTLGAQKYNVSKSHTQVRFTWIHNGFSNPSATLEKIDADFDLDPADLTKSTISVSLPLEGLHTGAPKLDEHLKTPDFFDASKYPTITFRSTKVEKSGSNALTVTGDLGIHGVTKPVTLAVKVNKIGENQMTQSLSAGFDADVTLSRSAFGIDQWASVVGDEIHVHITLEAHLAEPPTKN